MTFFDKPQLLSPDPDRNPQGSLEGWSGFLEEMQTYYNVDLGCLSDAYKEEQRDYYVNTAIWSEVHPSQMVGSPGVFKSYDLNKVGHGAVYLPWCTSGSFTSADLGV